MPITQGQMIEQMQEARALHHALISLRESLSSYLQSAKDRYPSNHDLQEVLTTALYTIRAAPVPDDRATYVNERHYSRRAKWNIKAQADQERKRRLAGIPEKREAMALMRERNRQSRDLAVSATIGSADDADAFIAPKADPSAMADPFTAPRKPSRPGIIFPRDDPDDLPLDFEGEASDSLFGNPAKESDQ